MSQGDKTLVRVLRGTSDANIPFSALCQLLEGLGFASRIRGDHHIFSRDDIAEILNLQPLGAKAKAYQVRQVRNVILKYGLGSQEDESEESET